MKTLPESPSIDHLRRQAKDLLSQLRLARPGTTLAEAQSALAETYGFRAWNDLKAEAGRLRADAVAAPDGDAATVAAAFDLGAVASPMTPLHHRGMAKDWSLTTATGRWLVSELHEWADARYVDAGVELMEAAAKAGVEVPRPVRTRDGDVVATIDGRRWRVSEWVDMGPEPIKPISEAIAASVGSTLGKLHALGLPTELPVNPWLLRRPSAEQLHDLSTRANAAGMAWAPMVGAALPTLFDLATIGDGTSDGELVLAHCSLTPESVRLSHGDGLLVLDWEYAGPLAPRWELGSTLVQWCTGLGDYSRYAEDDLDAGAARALASAYGREVERASSSRDGRDLGMFTIAITGYLNWVASRVNWAIPHEHSHPIEQQRAEAELPRLLSKLLSRAMLERLLEAVR